MLMIPLLASAQNRLRVSVLGDSYSTFQGYIPEGNETWYYTPADTSRTDVDNVTQTWWWQVINQAGCLIEKIDSYSGATVSNHGYNNEDYSYRSFVTRLPRHKRYYQYDDFAQADFYTYRPALAYLLVQAKERYPNVRIFFLINDILDKDFKESTKVICNHYDIPYIELKDIDKKQNHPTVKGMRSIAQQVLMFINK